MAHRLKINKFLLITCLFIFLGGCVNIHKPEREKQDVDIVNRKSDIITQTAIDTEADIEAKKKFEKVIIAPDFKLQDISGTYVTLSDYKEKKAVMLFFWATWCPFCSDELRNLSAQYAQLMKDGLELLAIDIGEPHPRVDRFIKQRAIVFKVLLDEGQDVAYAYDLVGVPTFVLVNKNGEIVFQDHRFPAQYKKLLSE